MRTRYAGMTGARSVKHCRSAGTNQCWALLKAAKFPFVAWTLLIAIAAALLTWRARPAPKFG
jgi:hypothetical protein